MLSQRIRPLDGVRGMAVLAVVLYHFSPSLLPGGFLGVDIFFVLSGFLITSLLVRERDGTGTIRLGAFWARRARRLLPALLVVLAVIGVVAFAGGAADTGRLGGDGFASLFYFANWHFVSSDQSYIAQFLHTAPSPLRHTWSLAIEEQFYLLWPLVLAGLAWVAARGRVGVRRVLVTAALSIAVVSAVLMATRYQSGTDPSRAYYGTDTHLHPLLIGAALGAFTALNERTRRRATSRLLSAIAVVCAIAIVVIMLTVDDQTGWLYQGGFTLFALLVAGLIAGVAQGANAGFARLFEGRALVGLGLISYGVYLWHWPIYVWIDERVLGVGGVALFVVRAAVTLTAALLSYRLVEQPIRKGRLRRLHRRLPLVLTPVAVAAVIGILFVPTVAASREVDEGGKPSATAVQVTAQYAAVTRCGPALYLPHPSAKAPLVELVGNSMADEEVPCLSEILQLEGYRFTSYTVDGAAPCDLLDHVRQEMQDAKARPDVVVYFALPTTYSACSHAAGVGWLIQWHQQRDQLVRMWLDAHLQVFLVPPPAAAGATAEDPEAASLRELAATAPKRVHVVDAGVYIRDLVGTYQWRMPCVPGGEPGCDRDGTVGVRLTIDGGIHLCTRTTWNGGPCGDEWSGGERRVAAAIADQLRTRLTAPPVTKSKSSSKSKAKPGAEPKGPRAGR